MGLTWPDFMNVFGTGVAVVFTCCFTAGPLYAPEAAEALISQASLPDGLSDPGKVDPQTLDQASSALEHGMAFYALSDQDVHGLYAAAQRNTRGCPDFEELDLHLTPDERAAARFIVDMMTQP